MSAAEVVAALFFHEMRYDVKHPRHEHADRFILSKGHAAPILYAAWANAGLFPRDEQLKLRRLESDLEGHPTPRLPFVDVATGSLGQGLPVGIGTALNARRIGSDYRTYVLLGDGESAEGSVWEAAASGAFFGLDNLCGITDVNLLGQSRATQLGHDLNSLSARWAAFGWHAVVVDGHDLEAIIHVLQEARDTTGRPTMILAKTFKGHGVSFLEGKEGWHGRPLKKGDEADRALAELGTQYVDGGAVEFTIPAPSKPSVPAAPMVVPELPAPAYTLGDQVATREAFGTAITALGRADQRVVALDADVKNSTFSERFEKAFPDRFFQCFIAEQLMVGVSMGFAARGAIPFPSTFACFLSRAADFIRMAGISQVGIKMAGSHAGVSIGEDGPSQMALEDLATMRAVPNCAVLYPCDAVSTERLVALMAYRPGPAYIRTSRPKTPVIYGPDETFTIGGSKTLRSSANDAFTIVAAGVTVFEALAAYDRLAKDGIAVRVIDAYSVQPIDAATLLAAGRATKAIVTVEDHYSAGGLGDAVDEAVSPQGITVHRLAVRELARSATPEQLLDLCGLSAAKIVAAIKAL
jgi:transketolase